MADRDPRQPASLPAARARRIIVPLAVVALVLIAFILRIYRLDGQSLWGDEMWSYVHSSRGSLAAVLESVRDDGVHPPLYYVVLYPWMVAAGQSEFAIRYPSVVFGTLGVAAIYVLGRRLGGAGMGLIAALLHTLSPIHVYYSQEARMYSLTILSVILSSYFFWRLLHATEARGRSLWAGYVLSSALAVNSHLFAIPVLGAHALVWIGRLAWKGRAAWAAARRCAAAQAATFALFAPWLAYVWERTKQLSVHVQRMGVDLRLIIRRCLSDFSAGVPVLTADVDEARLEVLLPFLLLLALALAWPWRKRAAAFLALSIGLVVTAVYYISFPTLRGWTRFFLAASPFYHLLLARGADGLGLLARAAPGRVGKTWRLVLPSAMILPLLAAQAGALHAYYTDPLYARWDYRGQMAEVVDDFEGEAAVILQGRPLVFEYYFPAGEQHLTIPAECGQDEAATQAEIAAIAAAHEKIWLVRSGPTPCDPNLRVEQWLREHTYRVEERWLEDTLFGLYLAPSRMGAYAPLAGPERVTFEGLFELDSYAIHPQRPHPGDDIAVALGWRAHSAMRVDYKFFLVLIGPGGSVRAQRDGMPVNWLWPTTLWEVGETIEDHWGLALPEDAPAGSYSLYVGAYEPSTGRRLSTLALDGSVIGDMALVAHLEVQ